jgi:hypothetical protein
MSSIATMMVNGKLSWKYAKRFLFVSFTEGFNERQEDVDVVVAS